MLGYTYLSKSIRSFELFKRIYKPDSKALIQVTKLGLPIGLTTLAEVGSFSAAAVIMGWIGKIELAAHGILMQIFGLAFMIPLGISQAATIRIGTALGEENKEKIYEASKSIYILGIGFGVLIIFTLILGGEFFINLFLDQRLSNSDEVLRFASIFLFFGIIFHIFDCGQILVIGLLRGLSDTKVPFYLCLLSYWGVGIPVAYILSIQLNLGGSGIWIGLGIGMSFCFATLGYRFKFLKAKL
jgi:Na+-driven multidrug efflux pump